MMSQNGSNGVLDALYKAQTPYYTVKTIFCSVFSQYTVPPTLEIVALLLLLLTTVARNFKTKILIMLLNAGSLNKSGRSVYRDSSCSGKNTLKSVPLSVSLNFTNNLIRLMRTYGVCTLPSNFFYRILITRWQHVTKCIHDKKLPHMNHGKLPKLDSLGYKLSY